MKTNVLDSSIEAYHEDKPGMKKLADRIMIYSMSHRSFTCHMIAQEFKKFPGTMSGVIKPLINNGDLVRELTKRPCEITGNEVYWIYNPRYKTEEQLPLFKINPQNEVIQ